MKRLALFLAFLFPSFAMAGDTVPKGDTYYLHFSTVQPSTGAPYTIAGTPTISVLEDGSDTESTAGITFVLDSARSPSVTGLHEVDIDTSNAEYEVGKYYTVVITGTTPTVDSVSVLGRVVGSFRVVAAETVAGVPAVDVTTWLGTAAATPNTAGVPAVEPTRWNDAAIGVALITLADIGTTVDASLASIKLNKLMAVADADDVADGSVIAMLASSTSDWSTFVNTTDSLQSIRDKQTDIETDTAEIGAAGAGLTAIPWNVSWNTSLGIISGSSATGTLSTTSCTSDLSGYGDDTLIGRVIVWTTGTAAGEASVITDYASSSGTLTYNDINTAPADADTFIILDGPTSVSAVLGIPLTGTGIITDYWRPKP